MQIHEVCKQTGLSKRTIRFYIEKGLIDPQRVPYGMGEGRAYSQKDVQALLCIAQLRRAQFSLDDIAQMMKNPAKTGPIASEHGKQLLEQALKAQQIGQALEEMQAGRMINAQELAAGLSRWENRCEVAPEDWDVDFARLDEEAASKEEKERAWAQIRRKRRVRKMVSLALALVLCAAAALGVWLYRRQKAEFCIYTLLFPVVFDARQGETMTFRVTEPGSPIQGKKITMDLGENVCAESLFLGKAYWSIDVAICIPMREYENMGRPDVTSILCDAELLSQYGTIRQVQAEEINGI